METEITAETLNAIKQVSDKVLPKKEKKSKKLPVYLNDDEFVKLMKVVKKPHHRLAYNLAFQSGMRIGEIVNLKPKDVDLKTKRILITAGKGNKQRIAPLAKNFPASNIKLIPLKCGIRSIEIAFHNHAVKSGIMKTGLVFHSLRHSFAVRCMEKGIPLNVIQQLLGHENIATTSIYTKLNPKDALEAYDKLW